MLKQHARFLRSQPPCRRSRWRARVLENAGRGAPHQHDVLMPSEVGRVFRRPDQFAQIRRGAAFGVRHALGRRPENVLGIPGRAGKA